MGVTVNRETAPGVKLDDYGKVKCPCGGTGVAREWRPPAYVITCAACGAELTP